MQPRYSASMHQPPVFNFAFQEELGELEELSRQAYAAYLVARDALFARYADSGFSGLDELWKRYCEAAETLERAAVETERFVGRDPFGF
jgi:hypothetical protein